jgi:hypothetical protein
MAASPQEQEALLARLCATWPGRAAQIRQLLVHVGDGWRPCGNLFVWGGAGVGKSAVVRCVMLRHAPLKHRGACAAAHRRRQFLAVAAH